MNPHATNPTIKLVRNSQAVLPVGFSAIYGTRIGILRFKAQDLKKREGFLQSVSLRL